jgi:alkylmercury lyase
MRRQTMTNTARTRSELVDRIWKRFQDVGFTPDFGPGGSKLLIALYQRLARDGQPIGLDDAMQMADRLGVTGEEARDLIEDTSEQGEDGSIRGIVGLSLNDHPHTFRVGEVELRNWCALDPLLITPVIDAPVEIESADPATGEPVRVTATAEGVESFAPSTAVMSVVVPGAGATDGVEAVWMMFCHHVHFFATRQSAEQYFDGKNMEVYYLDLEEAFELGRLTFGPLYEQL